MDISSATDNVSIDLPGKQHNEQEKRTGTTSTIKANHIRTRNFFRYPSNQSLQQAKRITQFIYRGKQRIQKKIASIGVN